MENRIKVLRIVSDGSPVDLNIPQPDPAWDYATVWECMNLAREKLDGTIKYLSAKEEGDKETDQQVYEELNEVINTCVTCLNLIAFTPPFED